MPPDAAPYARLAARGSDYDPEDWRRRVEDGGGQWAVINDMERLDQALGLWPTSPQGVPSSSALR